METSVYSAFGLDINDASLKVVGIDGNGHIRSYNSLQLGGSVIQHGRVMSPKEFKENIQEVISGVKGDKIRTKWCVVSLPDIHTFMKVFEVPSKIKERHIEDYIFQNYHEELPLGRDKLYLSWVKLLIEKPEKTFYSVVFGQKKIIDEYVGLLRGSGLRLAGIQPDSVAVTNAIVRGGLKENGGAQKGVKDGSIIVNFRPGYASIVYYDRGQIILISTLRMTALSTDRLISRILTRIEVGRRWYRQISGRDLKNIITVGYSELMEKLLENLSEAHDYNLTSGNHFMNVVPGVAEHSESINLPATYTTAIGLAENFN